MPKPNAINYSMIFAIFGLYPLSCLAQNAQPQNWNLEQVSPNSQNSIIIDQPSIAIARSAEPITINEKREFPVQFEQLQKKVSRQDELKNATNSQSSNTSKEVNLKQPGGKDACDNERLKNKAKICKDIIEKHAQDFERPIAPEVSFQNQELAALNQEFLSNEANITAQKIASGNELESIAAGSIAKTFIDNSAAQTLPKEADPKDNKAPEMPPSLINMIVEGTKN